MDAVAITYHRMAESEIHVLQAQLRDLPAFTERDAISARYTVLTKSQEELTADLSSAIGLFQRKSEIGALESDRLERCMADLIMLLIHKHLFTKGRTILIQGPVFPKLVGRIGYRFPRSDLTIAFVSCEERMVDGHGWAQWDGPFPGYEEEKMTRSYFDRSNGVRVDLFCQGLGRHQLDYVTPVGYSVGMRTKITRNSKNFLRFAEFLKKARDQQKAQGELRLLKVVAARTDQPQTVPAKAPPAVSREQISASKGEIPPEVEEIVFNGISSKKLTTQIGQRRYAVLREFLERDGHGSLPTRKNFEFLQFVEAKVKGKDFGPRFVYGVAQLRRWFTDFDAGIGP